MASIVIEGKVADLAGRFSDGIVDSMTLELALLRAVSRDRSASYDGNEIGGDEIRYFLYCSKPSRLLSLLGKEKKLAGMQAITAYDDDRTFVVVLGSERDLEPLLAHEATLPRVRKPRPGDCFAIPLADGRWGHAVYAIRALPIGDFVRVLDVVKYEPARLDSLKNAKERFPPIASWVEGTAKAGKWKWLGHWAGFAQEEYPIYRMSYKAQLGEPGEFDDWRIVQAEVSTLVGRLKEEQRAIEMLYVWRAEDIAKRIETGVNPLEVFR